MSSADEAPPRSGGDAHPDQPRRRSGRRILRSGGHLIVFDGDYAFLTFATEATDGGAA